MTKKSKSPQKTWELHSIINHCYSMNCFTATNVWVCKVYMMHSHVKRFYSGFQEPLLLCSQEYGLSILKQPYYEGGSKACEALVHHNREILINCKTTIEWVRYLWLMFSKFCWNNYFFEKRVCQPKFEYFRISTIVSKYAKSTTKFQTYFVFQVGSSL